MEKALKIVFVAKLGRYNFGDLFNLYTKEYAHYPAEEELLAFLNEVNETDEVHKDFDTRITVDKIFQVINIKDESNNSSK